MNTKNTTKVIWAISVIIIMISYVSESIAQTSHVVEVSNNKYTPSDLSVDVGDTVVWINIEGYHNVNGNESVNTENPESFGNETGHDWTYSFVFTIPGVYTYVCDPHVFLGMVGSITVNDISNSIDKLNETEQISIYPNPVRSNLNIINSEQYREDLYFNIYNISGVKIKQSLLSKGIREYNFDVSSLENGYYIIEFRGDDFIEVQKFLKE